MANEAMYKIKWILSNARPRARQLVFNEIIAMAKALGTEKNSMVTKDGVLDNNPTNLLENVFDYLENKVEYDIRFYPQVRGVDVPQLPSLKSPDEGIDPLSVAIQLIEEWAEAQIFDKIGLNDIRRGILQNQREAVAQSKLKTEYSLNQTGYISRIFQFSKKDIATTIANYTHDVIKYKQSTAAKWLKTMIGDEKYDWLSCIGNIAPHRMGIFMNDYTTEKMKRDVDNMVDLAMGKGQQNQPGGITIVQAFFLKATLDYKNEMRLLEIFQRKNDKRLRREKIEDEQRLHNNVMAQKQADKDLVEREGQLAIEKQKLVLDGVKYTADKGYDGKIDVKGMTNENDDKKTRLKTEQEKELQSHKQSLENQAANNQ